MSRQSDLETAIWESYEIARSYEVIQRTSDRPEEKIRARHQIQAQRELLREYLAEYQSLVRTLPGEWAPIASYAARELTFSSPARIYHNLPQPDYTFVGREAELARIHHILLPYPHSQHAVVTIDGIGGIGKSALALQVAYHYLTACDCLPPEERFEAIIWTSAKASVLTADGIKPRPQIMRTLEDIYTTISVALEREEITRARAEEQAALVTKALTQQRTLLIVDNLETVDDERIAAFLRELPAPTKAIVTTRYRIDVAYPVRLTRLPEKEGLALIAQECDEKGVQLGEADRLRLYQRTGGVPLAMVWSIAQIGRLDNVETVLERLGSAEGDVARFCFEGTMGRLDEITGRVLDALALCDQDSGASREAAGSALGLSASDRDEALSRLEVLSLVNKRGNRFTFLPLTRAYLLDRLDRRPEARQALCALWIGHFQSEIEAIPGEYYWTWTQRTFQTLMDEGSNVLTFLEWAYERGTAEQIFALTKGGCWYLEVVGRWREEFNYARRAADLSRSVRNHRVTARNLGIAGWILSQWGDLEQAGQVLDQALALYREAGSRDGECIALQWLGMVPRKQGHLDRAAELYEQAWDIACELGLGDLQALVNMERGKLDRDKHAWAQARDHFLQVRHWFETKMEADPQDRPLLCGAWGQLATAEFGLGNHETARDLFLKSLELGKRGVPQGFVSTLKLRLARVELALNHPQVALSLIQEVLYWFDRLGMKPDYEEARALLGQIEGRAGPDL